MTSTSDAMGLREPYLLEKELRAALPGLRLLRDEPMKNHCSFRVGGPAALFAGPASEEELTALRRFLWQKGVAPVVIGSGTNLLVADEGLRGVVIHVGEGLDAWEFDGERVQAGAGLSLSRLALAAQRRGLSGLEFAHGIPGSLGGGVVMNAGAYGGEMKDVVVSVRCLDASGAVETWETPDLGFAYRHSRFSGGDGAGRIILGATLRLTRGDEAEIGARMRELARRRSASQPLDKPSAGSAFKRPARGYAAALIEEAGLKGFTVGGAQVSEKHAGFIVNTGNATCADVLELMARIQKTIETRFGVLLEPEVKILR